ncbi:MAG: helix-turn-helix transcriptional regulator [Bifidobacterium scardovii]|uniref:helix-turn-helix domain-containing protein n=1 Tax=Bifidobacterium scardovii TaxID=158787 RepID=UPI0006674DD2|nr:helix-turn-helix transcriptional regulator [Bifidobacterium scardovii]MDU3736531.1 helix-turn-helix transcriptional regulator [Bifidobacterium scardovii]MDU5296842.1 helix-turn-helix transcriptional regulator [Bifidobacterium scardovii]MDU5610360.1 helix-turn-helix transcriptional regulator [Bifidobacterium scardovii]MDU5886439.1 helix-turn-helix transcriptional regulator [Bifidobacterium scardovii]MDU6282673.1 helix-turn-helix transcriptional regulator [Bifidobacterium scardovii]
MSTTELRLWMGQRLENLIKSKGMTKKAVSEKSGMPYSSLNSKLKGYRGFDLDDILALSEAIGEPPSELLPPQFHSPALADGGVR